MDYQRIGIKGVYGYDANRWCQARSLRLPFPFLARVRTCRWGRFRRIIFRRKKFFERKIFNSVVRVFLHFPETAHDAQSSKKANNIGSSRSSNFSLSTSLILCLNVSIENSTFIEDNWFRNCFYFGPGFWFFCLKNFLKCASNNECCRYSDHFFSVIRNLIPPIKVSIENCKIGKVYFFENPLLLFRGSIFWNSEDSKRCQRYCCLSIFKLNILTDHRFHFCLIENSTFLAENALQKKSATWLRIPIVWGRFRNANIIEPFRYSNPFFLIFINLIFFLNMSIKSFLHA